MKGGGCLRLLNKPPLRDYMTLYHKPPPTEFLAHYGVKGMKWGVRRTPEELGHRPKKKVEKTKTPGIIKVTVSGHGTIPKYTTPNSIVDHLSYDGKVDVRTFYGKTGLKVREINTTDHGHPKQHPWGSHSHDYEWNEDGTLRRRTTRALTAQERKENDDIL